MEHKLRAIGLREVNFGEHERYLTVLTEQGRKLEVLCKNVRRSGKKPMPAVQHLYWADYILYERAGRYTLREADVVYSFFALTRDIERYALACYLCEVTAALALPDEDNPALCHVLLHALYALMHKNRNPHLIKSAFEWRVMCESGYAPDLHACAVCGHAVDGQPPCFHSAAGRVAEPHCAGQAAGYEPLYAGTWHAMLHILEGEIKRCFSFTLGNPSAAQLCRLSEQYLHIHLDRTFESLRFYRSLVPPLADGQPSIANKEECAPTAPRQPS